MHAIETPPPSRRFIPGLIVVLIAGIIVAFFAGKSSGEKKYHHISGFAWDAAEWAEKTKGIRTSYNPDHDLDATQLTLTPGDPRWLDFVFWCFNNKLAEHQVEAYGGTEWDGPTGGVIFHWAPGSRWETHTLASFGFTIGHTIGEHKWMDTQFPDFFEKYGGVYGVNIKDRLEEIDPKSAAPWVAFLDYCGGPSSPYYRYLFHQEAIVDPIRDRIYLIGGQGVGFEYTFERYYHEVREVLTDAKAFQFFQMYDQLGPGFASLGGWAKNKLSAQIRGIYMTDDTSKWSTKPGVAKSVRYNPNIPSPAIPDGIPDLDAVHRGQMVYKQQCAPCHGIQGDGKGFLAAGFDVKPRDFTEGMYKFRTTKTGEFPSIEDIEHTVRVGVSGTTMPAWGQFLTDQQVSDVSRYLITFSDQFAQAWKEQKSPEKLDVPPVPQDLSSLAAQGKAIFDRAQCAKCHGDAGRGDGPATATLQDSWEQPIVPADLTYKWQFKNGYKAEDVYRTMFGGLNGTPMPSYLEAFPDQKDQWALVSYVLSLSPDVRPVLHLADYKAGVIAVSQRCDEYGRVRK
ncbi:MAG TPA: c-type cytochrome [Bacteroidota bacterium]|nr:c-type cytochrome [Bacteroidota bacterium]